MALTRSEGIVLKTHALGDTSRIVVVFTREAGMVRLVAKGARKTPQRFGFALEPLTRGRYVYYHKADRDLQLLSQADTLDPIGSRLGDLTRLAHAQAATELVDRLVWGEEPQPELFELLAAALAAVTRADAGALPAVTIAFELQVASLMGYRPRLDACAGCGAALSPRRLFSPSLGGMVCDRCATAAPVGALSADALAGLALLLSRPVEQAGDYVGLKRAGEIQRAVEAFLMQHFQRFHGLKSLELLRSLPAVAARGVPPDDAPPR